MSNPKVGDRVRITDAKTVECWLQGKEAVVVGISGQGWGRPPIRVEFDGLPGTVVRFDYDELEVIGDGRRPN